MLRLALAVITVIANDSAKLACGQKIATAHVWHIVNIKFL